MSRRTPIKELIEADAVTESPRRKSTRIAVKNIDEKEVVTPAKSTRSKTTSLSLDTTKSQKDDDEISVSSNASSTSNRRVTRAASKSPTRSDAEGPARRTRRASSTSSLNDVNSVSSPAPTRRRSTRSMSTSPTADLQEASGTGTPAKTRTRRGSISDKITPMMPIKETEKTEGSKESTEETDQADVTFDSDDNLPFKKKRKTLNLQTIEEKSFSEESEKPPDIKEDDSKKTLPKFSLSLLKNREKQESQEEKELIAVLNASPTQDTNSNNEKNIEVATSEVNGTAESDSVFNSSGESEPKERELLATGTTQELSSQQNSVGTDENNDKILPIEAERQESSINVDDTPEINLNTETIFTNSEIEVDKKCTTTETHLNPEASESIVDTSETESTCLISETPIVTEVESSPKISTDEITEKEIINDIDSSVVVEETLQVVPASPTVAPLFNLNESRTRRKSDRRSWSDSEEYIKKTVVSSDKSIPICDSLSISSIVPNYDKDTVKQNGLDISGSSDLSDKENQKVLETNKHKEGNKSHGISKEQSFYEAMEVEYASDIDKTVCVIRSEVIINSPKRSTQLLQEGNSVSNSSTPNKSLKNSKLDEDKVNNSPALINEGKMSKNNTQDHCDTPKQVSVEQTSILESSVLESINDPDEYEENHPSIVRSSDEEAAEAERKTYTKTTSPFQTPEKSKHPIFSDETYVALVVPADESDTSNDPDFEVTGFSTNSDNDKTFKELNAKIDDLVAKHGGDESSSEESVTHFLDEFAEEGEEDTPSEGSNDIIEEGESLGSSDTENDSDEANDMDSFIDDTEQNELLSGDEYDLGSEDELKNPKKRSRIISMSDSENEVIVNGEVQQDDDLEKMSTRPYCGLSPPSIISIRDSPTLDEKEVDQDSVTSVVINKEDNLQSLEKIKEISPHKNTLVVKKSPKPIADASTPNNSLTEDSVKPRKRLSSIQIQDNISVEDIQHGGVGDRINKVIDAFYSNIKESSLNVSDSFSLNISLDCVKSPREVEENISHVIEKRKSSSIQNQKGVSADLPPEIEKQQSPIKVNKRKSSNLQNEKDVSADLPHVIKKQQSPIKVNNRRSSNLQNEEDVSTDLPPVIEKQQSPIKVKKRRSSNFQGEEHVFPNIPAKSKKTKLNSSTEVSELNVIVSKIPVRQKDEAKKKNVNNTEILNEESKRQTKHKKSKHEVVVESSNQELEVKEVDEEKHKKKKKQKIKDISPEIADIVENKLPEIQFQEMEIEKPKKQKKKQKIKDMSPEITDTVINLERKTKKVDFGDQEDSDISTDLDKKFQSELHYINKKSKPSKKRKGVDDDVVQEIIPVKKSKRIDKLALTRTTVSSKIIESQNSQWVVEKTNVEYFPSSLLNVVAEEHTKIFDKVESKPKFLPSTSQDRKSWGYTRAKKLYPSTSNQITSVDYADTFSNKDFKNKMLFNPSRVKREDIKSYLKKKEKTKF